MQAGGALIDISSFLDAQAPPTCDLPVIAPDTRASITFTSGTTGQPKGVCQIHRALLHHCRNYTLAGSLSPDDRITLLTPCSLAASQSSLWGALLNGATLLPFDVRVRGLNALPTWMREHRPTLLHCVPTLFRSLVSNHTDVLHILRLLRLGGESIYASDFESFKQHTLPHCVLLVALSSTETGAACVNVLTHDTSITGRTVPIGKPTEGMRINIVDDSGKAVAPQQVGRIILTSRYLAQGYWDDPKLSAASFQPDVDDPTARTFDTGDLGRVNEQGLLEHCGRADARLKNPRPPRRSGRD